MTFTRPMLLALAIFAIVGGVPVIAYQLFVEAVTR